MALCSYWYEMQTRLFFFLRATETTCPDEGIINECTMHNVDSVLHITLI